MKKILDIYIDGSWNNRKQQYGYGVVVVDFETKTEHLIKGNGNNEEIKDMRNVAGELKAAVVAMSLAIKNNINEINLYYDYTGIEYWCTGRWKAKKVGTQKYRDYYLSIKDKLKVNFIKVKAHSNDKYNDLADMLAKEGANE